MKRILVVTSVHPPDDPRIRLKLIESLRTVADVRYAVRAPGPESSQGITVELLPGGRLSRSLRASWRILAGDYDVASVHDPELLPATILAGLLRRRVVFDLHENLASQMAHKQVVPRPLRPVAATVARWLLRLAERTGEVTLAEEGYRRFFRRPHPVFPNLLTGPQIPVVPAAQRDGVVYLGDITRDRGADVLVAAVADLSPPPRLTLIGRCSADLRLHLESQAQDSGVDLHMTGFLAHDQALPLVARHAVAVVPLRDLPNYRHSQPTKLYEYLAAGVPVVASDLPGSRVMLDAGDAVTWVLPGDHKALGTGIRHALADAAPTAAAVALAPQVARRFRWPTDEVRRFYQSRLPR